MRPAAVPDSASPCRSAMPEGELVLVVDDEQAIVRALTAALEARGTTGSRPPGPGVEALERAAVENPAVVILDLGLPDMDGVEVCRRIRAWSSVPIIVLTAEWSDEAKVQALDEGADDYITKPFSMPELQARLRVALRHRRSAEGDPESARMEVGQLVIDSAFHEVRVGGELVELTPKEFSFLELLRATPGTRAHAAQHPAAGVGARVRHRDAISPGVRRPDPQEAGRPPRATPGHRARRRVPAGGRLTADGRRLTGPDPFVLDAIGIAFRYLLRRAEGETPINTASRTPGEAWREQPWRQREAIVSYALYCVEPKARRRSTRRRERQAKPGENNRGDNERRSFPTPFIASSSR